jgi:murein DD-endopeptidase MepM/ murein hydrolase activator NlpD
MGEDKVLYYYAHMNKQAIGTKGKSVQAGDQIGAVGDNKTAMGTTRHLHIDMLPGSKYKFRPSCSGSSCSGYPFIDVQPYLNAAFQNLPKNGGGTDV